MSSFCTFDLKRFVHYTLSHPILVAYRISYNKLVLVYKILHDKTPNYLKKLCIPSSEVHTRNLRSVSSNNLAVIRPNTNIMKKSFAYSSAILWNKLPCNIKLSASLSIFKSKCFTYLKDISN